MYKLSKIQVTFPPAMSTHHLHQANLPLTRKGPMNKWCAQHSGPLPPPEARHHLKSLTVLLPGAYKYLALSLQVSHYQRVTIYK
jgi:hypothetical protein